MMRSMSSCFLLQVLLLAVVASAQNFLVQLDPFASDSIRIRVAPPTGSITNPELQGLLPDAPTSRTFHFYNDGESSSSGISSLTNGNLRIDVDVTTGFLKATRVSDSVVLLNQIGLEFGIPDVPFTRIGSVSANVTFAGTSGEKVYGLGEHRTGAVNQMPYTNRFADSQDYGISHGSDVMIPWYASSLGYGFLWNSAGHGSVSLSENSLNWCSNATLGIDIWITTTSASFLPSSGRSPYADLLSNYVDAVGHASKMPFYSTGFIQCKDRYRNQTQLLDVARGYVERQLPISVIVIDWKHWTAQGDWHFNPACWPDPQGMFDELQTMGIELMVTFWPFQSTESRHWANFTNNNYLVNTINSSTPTSYDGGDQYLVDETNPDARAAVFDGFWEGYGVYGIKTVWIDAAEPEHFGNENEGKWKLAAGTDSEVGEAWIQQHARVFAEGFGARGITPDDYFILPRSAWVGTWRYSAALWSGDIVSTFEELALQLKVLQGVMMSGISLWTTDIGGYHSGDPADPVFQEVSSIVTYVTPGA
jgi:alpha-D-xyloside xylohydrolase